MTNEQQERYKRHLLLPELGRDGQERLLASNVLIVGAGGLGSPVALYLAAAGVGHIGVADYDCVDISNLQRQVIHTTADVGRPKVLSVQEKIRRLNPDVRVSAYGCAFDGGNAAEIISGYDVVVDATDSLPVKYLINDSCVAAGIPYVHGAISRFTGNVLVVVPGSACFRCVFPDAEETVPSAESGVLGVVPAIAGSIQAAETVKLVTGIGEPLVNRLLAFDALKMDFSVVEVSSSPFCPLHGR